MTTYRPRFIVTFTCEGAGYGLTIGSNESSKLRAFRYARKCWESTAPTWAKHRLTSVSVLTAEEDDARDARRCARERAEANDLSPRAWAHVYSPKYL